MKLLRSQAAILAGRWSLFALLGLAMAVAGAGYLRSTFQHYDDEGYVLQTLNSFSSVGGLYDKVYSQYGPFFYFSHHLLHLAGWPCTADGARLLALLFWLAASGFSAAASWRLTRSTTVTVVTGGAVFMHTMPFVNEPSHPGGMVAAAVGLLAWLGTIWETKPARLAAAAGAIGAALALTKINVGIFVFAGAGAWWLLHLGLGGRAGLLRTAGTAALLGILPFALMQAKLSLDWVVTYAVVAAAAAVAIVAATARGSRHLSQVSDLIPLLAAAAAVAALTLFTMLARGSSIAGLAEGVLWGPLRHPGSFRIAVEWKTGALLFSLISLGLALWAAATPSRAARRFVLVGRLVVAAAFVSVWVEWPFPGSTQPFLLSYALAAAWLFVFPLGADHASQPARAWLALLLVTQALHAYPVAGSQVSWSTFLWIPLAACGAHEAWRSLFPRTAATSWWRLGGLAAAFGLIGFTLKETVSHALYARRQVRLGDKLDLPGARHLHLRSDQATVLRILSLNARVHAGTLFSLPGLFSFNAWSEVPAPTHQNTTQWFALLTPERQQEIRRTLEPNEQACIIFSRRLHRELSEIGVMVDSPLVLWLRETHVPAFALGHYEFWVRKGRPVASVGIAAWLDHEPAAETRRMVSATLAIDAGERIASVELRRFKGPGSEKIAVVGRQDITSREIVAASGGGAAGAPASARTPRLKTNERLQRIEFPLDRRLLNEPLNEFVLHITNDSGQRIAEAMFP